MKQLRLPLALLTLVALGILAGCGGTDTKSPDVSDNVRKSLDQAGLKDVSVSQDRDKGVVTLGGHAQNEVSKTQAGELAKSVSGSQVVANEIIVTPPGLEKEANAVNSDLDGAIEKNLDAALIENKLHDNVNYVVKSGVVTLTGNVKSESARALASTLANRVLNVKQVVNDLQISNKKASSSQ